MPFSYLVRCADDTLYAGWTTDVPRRMYAHNHSKQGAKYTRTRKPVLLVYVKMHETPSDAMRHEAWLKTLSRGKKEALIASLGGANAVRIALYDKTGQAYALLPPAIAQQIAEKTP